MAISLRQDPYWSIIHEYWCDLHKAWHVAQAVVDEGEISVVTVI